jgi:hypothetical protein
MARTESHGGGAQSDGLAVAQRAQSPTAKKECWDWGHVGAYWKKDQEATASPSLKRLRSACNATGALGDVSRGGLTCGEHRAWDHDLGWHEQDIPCGIGDEARARLRIPFGSSCKTSECIVDALDAWWATVEETEQAAMPRRPSTMDNGPESSGKRTQFLHRLVQFAAQMGQPIHLLYDPP